MPTFKRPVMLAECLRSIATQTFTDFEVLVCDNSPECEGRAVVEALTDSRFKYVPRPLNQGILRNVTEGFSAASSQLAIEVDDDDALYPDCLASLVRPYRDHPDLVLVFSDVDVVTQGGSRVPEEDRAHFIPYAPALRDGLQPSFTHLAAKGYVNLVASLIRVDVIDWATVPDEAGGSYDRYVSLVASRQGPAYYVDRRLVAYRVHPGAHGFTHASSQLRGALVCLERELPPTTDSTRTVLQVELLRTRVHLVRALRNEGSNREAGKQLYRLLVAGVPRQAVRTVMRDYFSLFRVSTLLAGARHQRQVRTAIKESRTAAR